MPDKFTIRKYNVQGIKINAAHVGRGAPLVFIHGWSNNWQGWTLLVRGLSPYYSIYLLDVPGFGDSDRLEQYSLDKIAGIIAEFIKQYAPKPKAIVGASLGTLITAYILTKYPEITDRAIFLGAIFKKTSMARATYLYRKILQLSDKTNVTQEMVGAAIKNTMMAYAVEKFLSAYKFDKHLVDAYNLPGRKKITGKSYVQLGLSAFQFNMEYFLKTAPHKILLIYGEKDKYVRPEMAQKFLTELKRPSITLHTIEKSGHNPAYEQPSATAEVIRRFLEQ